MRRWGAAVAALLSVQVWFVAGPALPAVAATTGFRALDAPQRLLDTRPGEATADGQQQGAGAIAAGGAIELPVAGRVGLPNDASAVVLNVTVTGPADYGFVTVYPCGVRPNASTLNYGPGQTVPNAVVATVSASGASAGKVCLYSHASAHLIVDASGWFPSGAYTPLAAPQRLLDSRPGEATADGQHQGVGLRPGQSEYKLKVAGRAGLAGDVASVVLNVTVTGPDAPGFVTVYPCGVTRPNASNLNYGPGQTVPNLVVSKVGANGEVCLYTQANAHLLVDASGAIPGATFKPLDAPARLLDTRPGDGVTVDAKFQGGGTQPAGATLQLEVTGRGGIPSDASAVVLNVTAVTPTGPGFLAIHPRGSARPTASNVNYAGGEVVSNAVVARLGRGGIVCAFNLAPTHVIIDVAGYLTGSAPSEVSDVCPSVIPDDPGARDFLVRRPALHVVQGVDQVAIVVCDIGADFPELNAAEIATWANAQVAPFFADVSHGQFTVTFAAHPTPRIAATGRDDCAEQAEAMTGAPFTNVVAITEEELVPGPTGRGGPGGIYDTLDIPVLSGPPSETGRGIWMTGGMALADPTTLVHELGHTIHWPHSYVGTSGDEYENPVDIMSGRPVPFGDDAAYDELWDTPYFCDNPYSSFRTECWVQNTIAFNRLAAGWIAGQQVATHWSGQVNYTLDGPSGGGVQLIAVPDPADPRRILTIEARPAEGRDQYSQVAGVAVHLIDQTGATWWKGISGDRRQAQASGVSNSYDHVVAAGGSATFHGVTVRVYQGPAGSGYDVQVSGTYVAPGALPGYEPPLHTQSVTPGSVVRRW